jgi:hypothetical protein
MIATSAERHGLKYIIPSFNGVHKCTFTLPVDTTSSSSLDNVSVVAGHFPWAVWKDLPSVERVSIHNEGDGTDRRRVSGGGGWRPIPVACFVMGRDPVDRVVSYYYQRCYSEALCPYYQKQFNDLTIDELRNLVMFFRQALLLEDNETVAVVDEGMEDAACRTMIGKRETTGKILSDVILPEPLTEVDITTALANCELCVVGLLEEWEATERVMQFWFPWMDLSEYTALNKFARTGKDASYIRDDLRAVIVELNQCDTRLYDKMKEIFQKQLRVVYDKSYEFLV